MGDVFGPGDLCSRAATTSPLVLQSGSLPLNARYVTGAERSRKYAGERDRDNSDLFTL